MAIGSYRLVDIGFELTWEYNEAMAIDISMLFECCGWPTIMVLVWIFQSHSTRRKIYVTISVCLLLHGIVFDTLLLSHSRFFLYDYNIFSYCNHINYKYILLFIYLLK